MSRDQTASSVPFEVGNRSRLLLILGQLHPDPRYALREFVQNAWDAVMEAGLEGRDAIIRVHLEHRHSAEGRIEIIDNGVGMTRVKLEQLPRELCSSDKLAKVNLEGQFGIGLLSYISLGENCAITTRSREDNGTWRLVLPSKSSLEKEGRDPSARIDAAEDRPFPGTTVTLSGISGEILQPLQPSRVRTHLARYYGPKIKRLGFRLEVVARKGKTYQVKPRSYRGVPFRHSVRTDYGDVEFELYLSAKSGERSVQLALGPTVIGNIAEGIVQLDHAPWNEGRIEGEIRCDFLEPLPTRKGVKPHPAKFPAFLSAVQEVEEDLRRQLARISQEQQWEAMAKVRTRIQEAFRQLAREERLEHQFRVAVEHPEGEEAEGAAAEERVPGGTTHPSQSNGGATTRKIERARTQTARQRWRRGIDLAEEEWEGPEHSRTVDGIIEINAAHPDYQKVLGDASLYGGYLVTCAMKEVVKNEWGSITDETVEELLTLQLGMQRLLKMGVKWDV